MADVTADANNTPTDTNLALNADGSSKTREWPRTFAYFSSSNDLVYNAVDGNKNFDSTSGKKIWCDWESGKYHTNADAAVGDSGSSAVCDQCLRKRRFHRRFRSEEIYRK